jgi:hypothetical protein
MKKDNNAFFNIIEVDRYYLKIISKEVADWENPFPFTLKNMFANLPNPEAITTY